MNHSKYKYIGLLLNIIIGINFLISAYAKIPSIEVFGWTIAESTPFNWTISEWLARLVIGLEMFLGILFLLQILIKKIAIPFSILLLVAFSIYLAFVLSIYGNDSNCGCYGEMIPLSTTASLIKNGILLIILFLASRFLFEIKFKFYKLVALMLMAGALILPFAISPPASIIIFPKEEKQKEIVPLHLIEKDSNYVKDTKKIIALVSPTCKYCKKAAKRMSILKKRNPQIPFQLIMAGHRNHLADFLKETRATNIPLIFMDSVADFRRINARNAVPTIKWLEDSSVVKTSTYFSLNETEIIEWLSE